MASNYFPIIYVKLKWLPNPVFLPEKFQGQRSLAGYSPQGHKRVRHDLVTKLYVYIMDK